MNFFVSSSFQGNRGVLGHKTAASHLQLFL